MSPSPFYLILLFSALTEQQSRFTVQSLLAPVRFSGFRSGASLGPISDRKPVAWVALDDLQQQNLPAQEQLEEEIRQKSSPSATGAGGKLWTTVALSGAFGKNRPHRTHIRFREKRTPVKYIDQSSHWSPNGHHRWLLVPVVEIPDHYHLHHGPNVPQMASFAVNDEEADVRRLRKRSDHHRSEIAVVPKSRTEQAALLLGETEPAVYRIQGELSGAEEMAGEQGYSNLRPAETYRTVRVPYYSGLTRRNANSKHSSWTLCQHGMLLNYWAIC